MSAQVIVIEKPADYSKRAELEDKLSPYGDIVYLFDSDKKPVSVWDVEFTTCILEELEKHDFCPLVDYVALVGSVLLTSLLVHSARMYDEYDQTTLKLLAYHPSKGGTYRPVLLPGE